MLTKGRDKAKATCDQSPYADRIWVTVEGDDFRGTIALSAHSAANLVCDLQSCIEDICGRKPLVPP